MAEAKVFECAGGYSPTIGIIGAVMGLIQVMKNLANIEEVGHGIAVAFVATVYGVGLANIFLLPAATKIKSRIERETELKELKLEGVVAIVEGLESEIDSQQIGCLPATEERRRRQGQEKKRKRQRGRHTRRRPSRPRAKAVNQPCAQENTKSMKITSAGWCPTPISSLCCSLSSW